MGSLGAKVAFPEAADGREPNPSGPANSAKPEGQTTEKSEKGLRFARIDAYVIQFHALWPYVGIDALGCSPFSTHGNSQN